MVKNNNLTNYLLVIPFMLFAFFIATPAYAQSIGESNQSSQSYGASNQSDFQNAAFQQTSSGSVPMAGGSADILKQAPNQIVVVTGAPAYQPPAAEPDNMTSMILWIILIASGIGIVALYIYQKNNQKVFEGESVAVASEVFDKPKPASQKPAAATKKPKKAKKKKAHR